MSIHWSPVIDNHIRVTGVVYESGAGYYEGLVHWSAGDADSEGQITLRLDSSGSTLHLTSSFIWSEPIDFTRMPEG